MSENITQGLLQGIFDASLSSIIFIKAIRDKENKIEDFVWVMLNQRALQMFPSPNGVMEVGKKVSEIFPTSLSSESFKRWVHTAETGEAYQVEFFYELEGFNNWFRERGVRFEDGVIVTSEDITEQKRKEEKLVRSEALLLESQDIAQLGAFQWNEDMTEGYWTPQMFNIYGVAPNSVKVTPELIASIVHPEDKERFFAAVSKVKITCEPYSVEYRAIIADGSIKHLWARGKMVDGKLTGTVMDITERKKNGERLKRSEQLLLESQEIAQLGTFQWSADMSEGFWTPQLYKIYGVEPYSIAIVPGLVSTFVHPEDKERYLLAQSRMKSSDLPCTIEYKAIAMDGQHKHIWARGMCIDGKITGIVMDITERKELELKNTRLAQRNDELDNFVYTASHDLRSPLNNIETLIQYIDKEMPEKKEKVSLYMNLLNKSITDVKNTIQDLTTVTEIHPGEKKQIINLNTVIEEVKVALFEQIEETAAIINIDLSIAFLTIPKKHARSLIYNLLSNALKFRSTNRNLIVNISSYLEADRVILSFSDNGIGIREADQAKVFMIFKRFNAQITGRGVGMYLVKRVVDLNHGTIHLQSQENVGTTFHVEFPISE